MNVETTASKVADTGAAIGWGTWILTHITQINEFAQFVLLVTSIVATVFAARYHFKRTK
jgi:hypothetical protein